MAAAAYQSGERLHSDYDQTWKHYRGKSGIVETVILLPSHVPRKYEDRATLWNSVEAAEKRWDAQLSRRLVIALPREMSHETQMALLREYCREQFVNRGMIADIALHNKGDGNPHAHVLLTMRAMNANGEFLPKARMVYVTDENGQRIKTANGHWKSRKENTIDWDDRRYAEVWRQAWADTVNRYYKERNIPARIDLRSYERQRRLETPTVHEGPAVHRLKQRGVDTMAGSLNDEIRTVNQGKRIAVNDFRYYSAWQNDVRGEMLERADAVTRQQNPNLCELMWGYMKIRADERLSWSRYGQRKGTAQDLHDMSVVFAWLQEQGIHSTDEFRQRFTETNEAVSEAEADIAGDKQTLRSLKICRKHLTNRMKYAPVYEKYRSTYFKMFKEKFEREHRQELVSYRTAIRYFKAHPEYERMKAAEAESRSAALRKQIEQREETLPELRQALQPYLQAQKFLRFAMEPPPMTARERDRVEEKQAEPVREESIHREPVQKKRRTNDLSL